MSDHDLTARLPPPHDEEPASLRSDIVDELRDHLVCASDRERRRLEVSGHVADTQRVTQAVVERFGDPASVARQLWFDAMKGRIMVQRVFLGLLAALVALVGVGIWRMTTTLGAIVDQNQKATAAILERMGKEQPTAVAAPSPEWIPVKFTLVQDVPGNPPLVGHEVSLSQKSKDDPRKLGQLFEKTNSEGIADFGLLPYGSYALLISSQAGSTTDSLTLRPGRPINQRIVVPGEPPTQRVQFKFAAPDWQAWKWKTPNMKPPTTEPAFLVQYWHQPSYQVDGRYWGSSGFALNPSDVKRVIVRADGIYRVTNKGVPDGVAAMPTDGLTIESPEDVPYLGDLVLDPKDRIDSLELTPGRLSYTAELLYQVPVADPQPDQIWFRFASVRLMNEFVEESRISSLNPKDPTLYPFGVNLQLPDANGTPQIIEIPTNHSATHDGEIENFGGGGFY
jgi:hypothetical protein